MESPDPGLTGDKEQLHRLVRGGAWYIVPRSCRSSSRNSLNPDRGVSYIGFRPCCPFPPGSLLSA